MTTTPTTLNYDPAVSPNTRAKTDVADPTAYGRPDATQQRYVGSAATVIPRAHGNTSSGRASFPTELIIDPQDPATGAGGKRIKLGGLDKDVMNKALNTAESAENAWDIVRELQTRPSPDIRPAAAPTAPPAAQAISSDLLAQLGALTHPAPPTTHQQPSVLTPPPAPVVDEGPYRGPPGGNPTEGPVSQQIQLLTKIVGQLIAQGKQPVPGPGPTPGPDPEPSPPKQRPPTLLESLELSFLSESIDGGKPTVPVTLEMGPGGQVSTKFHAVIVYGGLVVLVFDTRYDGTQFFPPGVEYTIKIKLPAKNESYRVFSRDCVFPIGKLEICVLVIAPAEETRGEEEEAGLPTLAPAVPRRRMPLPKRADVGPPEFADDGPPPEDEQFPSIL